MAKSILVEVMVEDMATHRYVTADSLDEMYSALACTTFTCPVVFPNGDAVFCDDEALLKPLYQDTQINFINGYPQPLIGKLLIKGPDAEEGNLDVQTPLTELGKLIATMTLQEAHKRGLIN